MEDISTQLTNLKVGDLLVVNNGANVGYVEKVVIGKKWPHPMDIHVRWMLKKYRHDLEEFVYEELLKYLTEYRWKIIKRKSVL